MTIRDENAARLGTEAAQEMIYQRQANVSPVPLETQSRRKLRPQSKRASMLRAFLALGNRGMNCFQAANQYHDYVLRSAISDFRRQFGLEFHRKYETVPGQNGSKVDCVRYWLSSAGAEKARELLSEAGTV